MKWNQCMCIHRQVHILYGNGIQHFFTCFWNSYHLYFIARTKTQHFFLLSYVRMLDHFISHSSTPSVSIMHTHTHKPHFREHTNENVFLLSGIAWKTYETPHSFSFALSLCILPLMKDNQKVYTHEVDWVAPSLNCTQFAIAMVHLWLVFNGKANVCFATIFFSHFLSHSLSLAAVACARSSKIFVPRVFFQKVCTALGVRIENTVAGTKKALNKLRHTKCEKKTQRSLNYRQEFVLSHQHIWQ